MKDSKSILLLVVSVLLILVSCALIWTWGYNFSNYTKEKQGTVFVVKDSTAPTNAMRDSLKRIYETTINNISKLDSTWSNADSLKDSLDVRLAEFYRLRNEIAIILKNPARQDDLNLAKQKISELQKKIDQLRNKAAEVETENRRLYDVLQQLTANAKENPQPGIARSAVFENKEPAAPQFSVTDIRLSALAGEEGKEQETNQSLQAEKFTGSFSVKNNVSLNNAEIYVVITQPDNKVLQASAWETGRFDTKDGKRIYSCKVKFEYSKGENKKLNFSLNNDRFQKGTYTMQIYFNGTPIAKTTKTLI